jgi:hypothetical protein
MGRSETCAVLAGVATALLLSISPNPSVSAEDPEPLNRRFLVIHEHDATLAANVEADRIPRYG